MLRSFLQNQKHITGRLGGFSSKPDMSITFENKIKALLSELGALKDDEVNIKYTKSLAKPLAGIKYSLAGDQLPDILLLEFYTDAEAKTDQFLQVLESKETISQRLMRNLNYVSADNSIVLPIKADEDEEKAILQDIKLSAIEFCKGINKDKSFQI
jgi:hypothetical protein